MQRLNFFKMQASGNDFLFVNCKDALLSDGQKIAENVCKRRFSVGGDGLITIENSLVADCKITVYNADGSIGKTCGNALRCVGVYLSGQTGKGEYLVQTDCGVHSVKVEGKVASCKMGRALFRAENLPKATIFVMPYGDRDYVFTAVSVGNPHAVAIVEDFNFDLNAVAVELAESGIFPEGVNVEFVVLCDGGARARVIERGSGETLSCGSGACAIAATLKLHGLTNGEVKVFYSGGVIEAVVEEDYSVTISGEANLVCEGVVFYG